MICQTKDVFSVYLVISSFSPNKEKTLEIEIGFYLDEIDGDERDQVDDFARSGTRREFLSAISWRQMAIA
jgi:hypothetical protein